MSTEQAKIRKKQIRFIVNPVSGVGGKQELPAAIQRRLSHDLYQYEICYTERQGHATELAAEAVEQGVEVVVAVGGDGSVNEVAAALIGTDTVLGVLPAGSGNGFAMHLGLGRSFEKAIEVLNEGKVIRIDSCVLNERPFVNLSGVGFDAMVAYQLKQSSFRGFLAYFYHSMKAAWNYQPGKYRIHFNDQSIERDCLLIEVANSPMFGYNFRIAPQASLIDGLLELILIKKVPKWRYFLSAWRFINNSFHKSSLAECYSAENIRIEIDKESYVHMDGEGFLSCHNLHFSINKLSLQVLVPNSSIDL